MYFYPLAMQCRTHTRRSGLPPPPPAAAEPGPAGPRNDIVAGPEKSTTFLLGFHRFATTTTTAWHADFHLLLPKVNQVHTALRHQYRVAVASIAAAAS